jgi:hypothetical protein
VAAKEREGRSAAQVVTLAESGEEQGFKACERAYPLLADCWGAPRRSRLVVDVDRYRTRNGRGRDTSTLRWSVTISRGGGPATGSGGYLMPPESHHRGLDEPRRAFCESPPLASSRSEDIP